MKSLKLLRAFKRYLCFKYYKSISRKISFNQHDLVKQGYHSQCGQDKYVAETLLPNLNGGFFVDIGANDGVTFNNSLYFEKIGWNGLAIEPHPSIYKALSSNRKCFCINVGVGPRIDSMVFRAIKGPVNMLSGFVDLYDTRHIERIDREINLHGGKYEDVNIPCKRLTGILQDFNVKDIDFLSIDVEGCELDVLESIDFREINISVISVENNYKDYRIPYLLHNSGFKIVAMLGDDNLFLNKDLL